MCFEDVKRSLTARAVPAGSCDVGGFAEALPVVVSAVATLQAALALGGEEGPRPPNQASQCRTRAVSGLPASQPALRGTLRGGLLGAMARGSGCRALPCSTPRSCDALHEPDLRESGAGSAPVGCRSDARGSGRASPHGWRATAASPGAAAPFYARACSKCAVDACAQMGSPVTSRATRRVTSKQQHGAIRCPADAASSVTGGVPAASLPARMLGTLL